MTFFHRTARREDLAGIVEIYNSTVPLRMVTADTVPVSVASRLSWFEEHTPSSRPLWVVEMDGEVAAWLSFADFYGRPAYSGTAELSIYVHEMYRKMGIGAYLLDQALDRAPALKVDTLVAFIFGHNYPSISLFGKSGFSEWGRLPGVAVLNTIKRDLVILGRHVKANQKSTGPEILRA